MKKKKWLIIYIAAMLCVALWLVFSNRIVLAASGLKPLQSCSFEDENWGDSPVYGFVDRFSIANDLQERVFLNGWAFAETEEENQQRKTTLLLRGDSISYRYDFKFPDENDTFYSSFISRGPMIMTLLNRTNPNPAICFVGEFSTLGMADGEYAIYLACWENDTTSGVTDTGIRIRKNGAMVERIDQVPAEETAASETDPEETVKLISEEKRVTEAEECKSYLDLAQAQENIVKIIGWAFVPGKDSTKQTLYLECLNEDTEDQRYGTVQYERPGFTEIFNDAHCGYAGFDAYVPLAAIKEDGQKVRVLVENDGAIWSSAVYTISKADDGFRIEF